MSISGKKMSSSLKHAGGRSICRTALAVFFALFTDHHNMRYMFDPHSVSASGRKYTADKLHLWSLLYMT